MACKYCEEKEPIYESYTSDWTVAITDKKLYADRHYSGTIEIKINYCPMCGEKLREQDHGV